MKKRTKRTPTITVRISGPVGVRDIVRRTVASALSNLGAFDVTSRGDPGFAGNGGCDPEWMHQLADLAADGTEVVVECD